MKLYAGAVTPQVMGPAGRLPQLLFTDDEPAAVASALDELCGREDVRPQDVVVLSAHGRDHSAIYGVDTGRWQYTDKRGRKGSNGVLLVDPGVQGPRVAGGRAVRTG